MQIFQFLIIMFFRRSKNVISIIPLFRRSKNVKITVHSQEVFAVMSFNDFLTNFMMLLPTGSCSTFLSFLAASALAS